MRIISHRGNLNGPGKKENHPVQIDTCLNSGFDSEIDLWVIQGDLFLGHDSGNFKIDLKWLEDRKKRLWIHCKNAESLNYFTKRKNLNFIFFWHQNDYYALTSNKKIWVFPGNQLPLGSIAVLPELWLNQDRSTELLSCFAICTDYPKKYKDFTDKNN